MHRGFWHEGEAISDFLYQCRFLLPDPFGQLMGEEAGGLISKLKLPSLLCAHLSY
jgi:hypothetical protein